MSPAFSEPLPAHGRAPVALLLLAFALAGLARLNPLCLLEPDAAEYLFTSRSLATGRGYTEIDRPGEPPHTFRPPGLPLLLVPLSLVRPYDVVGAKLLLLAGAVLVLGLVHACTRQVSGTPGAIAATGLVATSPYTLLHGTEVVTEAPFVACTLGVLLLISRTEAKPTARRLAAITALVGFAPLLRTIGGALVAGMIVWSLLARRGPRWLVAAAAAALPTLAWASWSGRAGGPTYLASIASQWEASGPSAFLAGAARSLGDYLDRLADVLLPGVRAGQPLYERLLLGSAPDLGAPKILAGALAWAVTALSALGMLGRRRREGALALLYLGFYLAGLAVFPPKHERLVWPLVPLVWIYLPAGVDQLRAWLHSRAPHLRTAAVAGLALLATALGLWQAATSAAIVRTNLRWLLERDRFYQLALPPIYYADWQAAGRWIRDHSPAHARVLTRHSDVGFTARRYQESIRFEELSPAEWRERLARLGARYLVVPTSHLGKFFHWPALGGDPVYSLTKVYEARDVAVLEVAPNRAGTVRAARPDDLEARIEACRRAVARVPSRADLERRLAELLAEAGRPEEALGVLQARVRGERAEAHEYRSLGSLLLELGRHREALEAFQAAATLPGAGEITSPIRRGIERAQQRMARSQGQDPAARARELVELARWATEVLDYSRALAHAEEALDLAPSDAAALFTMGEIQQRLGRLERAEGLFQRAGHPGAEAKLRLLEAQRAVEANPTPGAEELLRLAELLARDGTPGKALALLEAVADRPDATRGILVRLSELYLFYGLPEKSLPLYRRVLDPEMRPGAETADPEARRGLDESLRRLEVASL